MQKALFVQLIPANHLEPDAQKSYVPTPALGCCASHCPATSLSHLLLSALALLARHRGKTCSA